MVHTVLCIVVSCIDVHNSFNPGLAYFGITIIPPFLLECKPPQEQWLGLFFLIFILYGGIVDEQSCVSFRCTAKWTVIHIHVSILFQILFPFRLLQNTEQSALCYTVGPCWLSILNIVVCTCQSQTPKLSLPCTFPLWGKLNHKLVF